MNNLSNILTEIRKNKKFLFFPYPSNSICQNCGWKKIDHCFNGMYYRLCPTKEKNKKIFNLKNTCFKSI